MNAATANVINAIALIALGLWGYFDYSGDKASFTALIPVGFGAVLLAMSPAIAKHNKTIAHIAVTLTLLIIIALVAKPLMSAIGDGKTMAIVRIGLMVLTSVFAMAMFMKSFVDARKARESAAGDQP